MANYHCLSDLAVSLDKLDRLHYAETPETTKSLNNKASWCVIYFYSLHFR